MRKIFIFLLAIVTISCSEKHDENILQGYVEGRLLNLAPRSIGVITGLNVEEGDLVQKGDRLFAVDSERAQTNLDEAIAASAAADARLQNLRKGGRPEEIRAAQENLRDAEAALKLAQQTFERTKSLVERGVLSTARLDQDQATLDSRKARVTEARSRLEIVGLPARDDVINAAEKELDARKSAILRAETELKERSVIAPADGRIEIVYRREGEIAGPTQAVLSLLPPTQKRIRFFVKEPMLPKVKTGGHISINCDNCESGLEGEIVYIADQAEFTPPVIFSETERAKLVFLVEAIPAQTDALQNGQPVEVSLK